MGLAELMAAEGLDDAAMASKVGRSRVTLSRYRRGSEPIPGEVVKLLVELSGGRMTANELLGIEAAVNDGSPLTARVHRE